MDGRTLPLGNIIRISLTPTLWHYNLSIMKRNYFIKQDIVIQTILFCLTLLLSGILFVSGSMAAENCRQSSQHSITPFDVNSTSCNACCNTEHSKKKCPHQCSLPVELPKVAVLLNGSGQRDSFLFDTTYVKYRAWSPDPEYSTHIISVDIKYKSPPIFLQNESFLI